VEYSAYESALDRFVKMDKEFVGRDGLAAWEERGRDWAFVTLEVENVGDADARGSEVILKDGEMIGRATSGGYGFRVGKSLALAMVKPEFAAEGTTMDLVILGEKRAATVIGESPFDPTNERLRA
ncbi:MAG: glycine cleavage T C-terminal barrel domain-containing protein, partial [Pseudomonadota bacterium]